MSRLTIHNDQDGAVLEEFRNGEDINLNPHPKWGVCIGSNAK